ncbi:MAG: hypothetical protein ACI37T_06205 [Candidatus Gastranaerophilaceae bacterium]
MQTTILFMFLKDSFINLKKDELFFKTLNKEDKKSLNLMIKSIECIILKLEEILLPLSEGLKQ